MIIYRMHKKNDPFAGPFIGASASRAFTLAAADGITSAETDCDTCYSHPNPVDEGLPTGPLWYCATKSLEEFRRWFPKYTDKYFEKEFNTKPFAYDVDPKFIKSGTYQVMVMGDQLTKENKVSWPEI